MHRLILILIGAAVLGLAVIGGEDFQDEEFHTDIEMDYYLKFVVSDTTLVDGWNELFAASGECKGCHGYDPAELASITSEGEDINVVDDWRATMMANSAKDPFWRAKVSHESMVTTSLQDEIESSCTDCHAPLGFYNAMHLGMPHYTMEDLKLDSVALDGVSCGACHQISPDGVGLTFSGIDINYVQDTIYGQYEDPFAGPMQSFVGFLPVYSEHIQKSEVCASCHTLITETLGLDGIPNGSEFVEQATYHEWVNSSYNVEDESAMECQTCHMTRVDDDIVIASNLLFLGPRNPFFKHDIVGGNSFMLEMMKEHRDTLDIRASGAQYNSVISSTLDMLQNRSVDMLLSEVERTSDTIYVDVELTNKAGHKFPSAYPSRIAYVQVLAITAEDDTLFRSGMLDDEYELIERDDEYEQHYDHIVSESEVQIYELVMGDETGAETTVLSQADYALKDNRLAPFGFTDTHYTYDTVAYVGEVLLDNDFNIDGDGVQGTGKDLISYHIPLAGYSGSIEIQARVFYQVTPPRWLESMFEYSSEDIDLFQWMYENADKDPVEVASESILSLVDGVEDIVGNNDDLIVFPNPTVTGEVALYNRSGNSVDKYEIYDATGKLISAKQVRGNTVYVQLPESSGFYFIKVESRGVERLFKIMRY
jgi:hypothetical protein